MTTPEKGGTKPHVCPLDHFVAKLMLKGTKVCC